MSKKNTSSKTVSLELSSREFLVLCRFVHQVNMNLRVDEAVMATSDDFRFGLHDGEYDAFCTLVTSLFDVLLRRALEPSEVWS